MKRKLRITALIISFVLLTSTFSIAGVVSAQEEKTIDDFARLEQGTNAPFDIGEDWGNYIAINMSSEGHLSWFGIGYGTEDEPGPIVMFSLYARYLGGATVVDENGGVMIPEAPIPVVSAFAQGLAAIIEFNDTGYPDAGGRVGAGNGLFDFEREGSGVADFDLQKMEPVYGFVELKEAWELSDVKEITDEEGKTKEWEFSLTAKDVEYKKVQTQTPGVVDEITFTFHVSAELEERTAMVPWYEVTIDDNDNVVGSKEVESREFTGDGINCEFKYDHIIKGWDYTAKSDSSRLMLETFVGFGTFIPDIVEEWLSQQFVEDHIEEGLGVAEIETFTGGEMELKSTDDIPDKATQLKKDEITFKDNWEKVGKLSWVSDVTVDGEDKDMYFQIHAGENVKKQRGKNDDGNFNGIFLLGGYIYPAGADIYHDPSYVASTILLNFGNVIPPVFMVVIFAVVGGAVVTVIALGVVELHNKKMRKRKEQELEEMMRGSIPPNYGQFR